MKKMFFALLFMASTLYAATDVRELSKDCVTGAVSVSTTTPTAIPTTALSGRYKITVQDYDGTYDLAIGTHSAVTFAAGFIVTSTTTAQAMSDRTIYFPSGKTLYGLGAANTVRGTVNVRYMECK